MPILRTTLDMEEVGKGSIFSAIQSIAETESVMLDYQLADGTTDQQIPQSFTTGIATPNIVLIKTNQDISWRVAASDTAIPISANGFALLYQTSISNLLLSNASGATAEVRVWLSGVA